MTTTSWTDTPNTFCDCEIDHCEKLHPATEIIPDRYAFWDLTDRKGSYYAAGMIEDFVIEVTDMGPYEQGECVVRDLETGAELDAVEFLARFAAVAA